MPWEAPVMRAVWPVSWMGIMAERRRMALLLRRSLQAVSQGRSPLILAVDGSGRR
jgi:hypothetical protein